jgi:hypothetical protein
VTPISSKGNALVVFGLTATLVFAQYHLAKLPIRPFNLDPCDAVTHCAFILIGFVLVISLFGALSTSGSRSSRYILRYQQTFALAVLIMLLADVVDLARHPFVWITSGSQNEMLAWVAVYVAVAVAMQSLIHATQGRAARLTLKRRMLATLVFAAAALVLFACPEYGIKHTSETAHILTVAVGVFVVLIPIRVLLPVLVPGGTLPGWNRERLLFRSCREWGSVVIGVALFALAFWGQFHEVRIFHLPSRAFSGTIGAVLMIYAFLAEPLGLIHDAGERREDSQQASVIS